MVSCSFILRSYWIRPLSMRRELFEYIIKRNKNEKNKKNENEKNKKNKNGKKIE